MSAISIRISRQNSVVGPRNIADDRVYSVFEAIETIIWKPAIVSVVPIVSKFLETTGTIETIRTIIWKPGLRMFMMIRCLLAYKQCHAEVGSKNSSFKFVNKNEIYISILITKVKDQIWLNYCCIL